MQSWEGVLPGGAAAITWLTGDINGDGRTDIIQPFNDRGRLAAAVYRSNGTGYSLASNRSLGEGAAAIAWLTGDANGDGRTDLLQLWNNSGRLALSVYSADGQGLTPMFRTENLGEGAGALGFLTGDVDGDRRTDLIQLWNNQGRLAAAVYTATGTGYIRRFRTGDLGAGAGAVAWLTGDSDGDGRTDLIQLWNNQGHLGVIVYRWTGAKLALGSHSADLGTGAGALLWLPVDADNNGRTDILQIWNNGGKLAAVEYVATDRGYAQGWSSEDLGESSEPLAWLAGDVNRDGLTDLVLPRNNGGRLALSLVQGLP